MEFKHQLISTPPKLSLFSLPSKPPSVPDGLTPPPNTVAAIPFLWEEAPGKPRPTASDDPPKSKTVRSLDLPPRLAALSPTSNGYNHRDTLGNINIVGMEIIRSPTTVLGGPYGSNIELESSLVVGRDSGKSKGKMRMPLRKLMKKEMSPVKIRSWRWHKGRDNIIEDGLGDRSPSVRFCSWRWDSFRDGGSLDSGGEIGKVARKNGSSTSGFLAHMYGSIKQAMQWRS